jgi:tetratricopeptide (TPR) repeat protein
MVRTLIGLNETEKAIDILESLIDETNSRHIFNPLVMAYVKKQKFEELDELLNKTESGIYRQNTNYLYFLSAYYAQLFGFEEAREKYAKLAIDRYKANNSRNQKMLGRSYDVLGDFTNAQKCFEQYLEDSPSDVFCKSKLAAIAFNRGNLEKAYKFISSIRKGTRPYDFGYSSYFIGQAFAQSSHQDSALIYLKEAMLSGDRFSLIDYENDPFLADLHKTSDWLQFMDTWTINNERND